MSSFDPILLRVELTQLRDRGRAQLEVLPPWKNTGAGFAFLTTNPFAHKRMEWVRDVVAKLHERQLGIWATAFQEAALRLEPDLEGLFDTTFAVFIRVYQQGLVALDTLLADDSPIFSQQV